MKKWKNLANIIYDHHKQMKLLMQKTYCTITSPSPLLAPASLGPMQPEACEVTLVACRPIKNATRLLAGSGSDNGHSVVTQVMALEGCFILLCPHPKKINNLKSRMNRERATAVLQHRQKFLCSLTLKFLSSFLQLLLQHHLGRRSRHVNHGGRSTN